MNPLRAAYRPYRPHTVLTPFLEACWEVNASAPARHLVVPDGCMDLVFSPSMGLQVVGAMTTWSEFDLQAGDWVIGVRFRPGAAQPFLRMPPGEFTDQRVPLEDVWGAAGGRLQDRVGGAATSREALALLAAELGSLPLPAEPVASAVRAIVATAGTKAIQLAAASTSISPRQLRRVCVAETGLTPKQLARVLRFRRAGRLMASGALRGAATVAAECGYYDQAHLIREFRLLTGRTPSAYLPIAVL